MEIIGEQISFGVSIARKINFVEIGETHRYAIDLDESLLLRTVIQFIRNRGISFENGWRR